MKEYPKINTLFKRDMTNKGRIIESEWAQPEFEYLRETRWQWTEKVDGTNIRIGAEFFINNGNALRFSGRTDKAQIPAELLGVLHKIITFGSFAAALPGATDLTQVTLYGEGYGAKIQDGGEYRADQSFVLFDVLIGDVWMQRHDVEDVAAKLGIYVVPIVGEGTLHDAIWQVKRGLKSVWGDFTAEGLVVRPSTELRTRAGHRIIGKIKHRDFAEDKPVDGGDKS